MTSKDIRDLISKQNETIKELLRQMEIELRTKKIKKIFYERKENKG